jgi:hypothetical protein
MISLNEQNVRKFVLFLFAPLCKFHMQYFKYIINLIDYYYLLKFVYLSLWGWPWYHMHMEFLARYTNPLKQFCP